MPSILLVDDDADIRLLLRKLLVDEGFVVHTAHDGRHALHLLEKIDPPSVILLDYRMPVMDGKHCLAAIRRNTRLQRIPVVLLSAWTREWSGAHLEVADVLSKPVDPDLLVRTVRRFCSEPVWQGPERRVGNHAPWQGPERRGGGSSSSRRV